MAGPAERFARLIHGHRRNSLLYGRFYARFPMFNQLRNSSMIVRCWRRRALKRFVPAGLIESGRRSALRWRRQLTGRGMALR